MKDKTRSGLTFFLLTTAAWPIAAVSGLWLLGSPLIQWLQHNFPALAVVLLVGALIISLAQWAGLEKAHFLLWFLATFVGLGVGLTGMILAYFMAHVPVWRFTTGVSVVDFLIWLGLIFLLSAFGSAPGGLVAGILSAWSVGKGKFRSWIAVSIGNWALSFGAAGVLLVFIDFSRVFYRGNFRHISTLWRGAALGALIGLIQGLVLGLFLKAINQRGVSRDRSDTEMRWRRMLWVLLILPVVGCLLGYGISRFISSEHETVWEYLSAPPSPAVRFVSVSPLVVSSEDGEMYRYVSKHEGWKVREEKPSGFPGQSSPEVCEDITPPPLADTVDAIELCGRLEMGYLYRKFAILEDGSVWMWKKDSGMELDGVYYALLGSLVCFVLGLLVVASLTVYKYARSKRPISSAG